MSEQTPEPTPGQDPEVEETERTEGDHPPFYHDPEGDDAPESTEPEPHLAEDQDEDDGEDEEG